LLSLLSSVVVVALIVSGCETVMEEAPKAEVVVDNGRTFIVDKTGKRWDVTHAASKYGFVPSEFQFGLGPNAIKPINSPSFVGPGQSGYPSADEKFIVIGTTLLGESRAYAIADLTPHEVVNEQFVDEIVAVGW